MEKARETTLKAMDASFAQADDNQKAIMLAYAMGVLSVTNKPDNGKKSA